MVRIAPNELSFATVQAYHDIYGHATKIKKRFVKSSWYDTAGDHPGIVTVRDPAEHSRQRKYLSHAFSAKSLRGQENLIHHYVDMFIGQLAKLGNSGGPGINIEEAFNWLTFDIIGNSLSIQFSPCVLTCDIQVTSHSASPSLPLLKGAPTFGCPSSSMGFTSTCSQR